MFIILCMLTATNVYAGDQFNRNANPRWASQIQINRSVSVDSQIELKRKHIRLIRETYKNTKRTFFNHWDIDYRKCDGGNLNVKIITEYDLDNKKYFPGEDQYSDVYETVVGRYFRHSNTLYIVPPFVNQYYWRKDFAHELIHYFYDYCGIKFRNDREEHKVIDRFIKSYSKLFY